MGMRYARLRVTEIKMEPDLYFGSVPPGLYALWLNNNDAGEASLQRRFVIQISNIQISNSLNTFICDTGDWNHSLYFIFI